MNNFCEKCGTPLQQGYNVCPNCGAPLQQVVAQPVQNTVAPQPKNKNGYFISTGVIMIVLAILLFAGASGNQNLGVDLNLVFRIPAVFALIGGILSLCGLKNKILLIVAGCMYFVGAIFNIIGIKDISLFTIAAIIFGVLNIVFALKK